MFKGNWGLFGNSRSHELAAARQTVDEAIENSKDEDLGDVIDIIAQALSVLSDDDAAELLFYLFEVSLNRKKGGE